jgi:3'-phosphoadenosine 5'-phosphosulfate sulfotransferase (PAPS reductase)/FAD synthetase
MTENEFILQDRICIINDTINKWDIDNFYLSFSGGKDSTVLSKLLDLALPGNQIPRVFINTGIEYLAIVAFVMGKAAIDKRFVIIKPSVSAVRMLQEKGYPFKSKEHSSKVGSFQSGTLSPSVIRYSKGKTTFDCPKELLYQFNSSFHLKLSNKCCYEMKKNPARSFEMQSGRRIAILGLRMAEGGQRKNHKGCAVFEGGALRKFKPLNPISDQWEDWFVKKEQIKLCDLYYPPFDFKRTGCKGCPYSIDLEKQLEIMERLMPAEAKQCEIIWKPVYEEYRRIGYRLKKNTQIKLF